MKRCKLIICFGFLLVTFASGLFVSNSCAIDDAYLQSTFVKTETLDAFYTDSIKLVVGEIESISTINLRRISITDPNVADVVEATDDQIDIIAKEPGETSLFVWDENGKQKITVYVYSQELMTIKQRVETLLKAADVEEVIVEINEKEGRVMIFGEIPEYKEERVESIATIFEEEIINLTRTETLLDMIQIDMQVTEVSTTFTKNLGVDWGTNLIDEQSGSGADTDLFLVFDEGNPNVEPGFEDFFKFGKFQRAFLLQAKLNALVEEGNANILSRPKVVVASGEEAKILVGGEIPVRTTTASTEGATIQENVEFKEFGVGMTLTPTLQRGKINIVLNVEISDIDRANAVGDDVAFTSRQASTNLHLDDNQTVIIGGLIKKDESETLVKVPWLADVPILGVLFRNRSNSTPDQDQEIIITLTPTILKTVDPPTPTDGYSENKMMTQRKHFRRNNEPSKTMVLSTDSNMHGKSAYNDVPKGMVDYIKAVQARISSSVVYPQEAKDRGWEGTVKLGMIILNDGTLAHASVMRSSGYEVIDEYALNTAKNTAPYSDFPSGIDLQEINVTIPIVYSLQSN